MSETNAVSHAPSPFFVIGSVRTGTTLVERILNRHSGIAVPPETFFFTALDRQGLLGRDAAPPRGLRQFVERYVRDRAFGFLDLPEAVAMRAMMNEAAGYRDLFTNLMATLSERAGKPRWGEKTPNNLRYVAAIREYFPDARFVMVVRDGRAAVLSRLRHPVWRRNLLAAARHWADDAAVLASLRDELHDSTLFTLRFEELLRQPEAVVRALCAFLDERYEPAMLHPDSAEASDAAGYYQQPWMMHSTRGINPGRADYWRLEYTPRRLRVVEAAAGDELRALGYPLVQPPAPAWQALYALQYCGDLVRRARNRFARRSRLPGAARPERTRGLGRPPGLAGQ